MKFIKITNYEEFKNKSRYVAIAGDAFFHYIICR